MDCFFQILPLLRSGILGNQDIRANGKSHKHIDHQIDERCGRTHCRKGFPAGKMPHHNDICRVKQQLQNTGKNQRNRKSYNFWKKRSVAHIHFVGFPRFFCCLLHDSSPIPLHISRLQITINQKRNCHANNTGHGNANGQSKGDDQYPEIQYERSV